MTMYDWQDPVRDGYLLGLLAWAEKDGEPVHPALRCVCIHGQHCDTGCCWIDEEEGACSICHETNVAPNQRPMALLSAATRRWKEVRLDWDDGYVKGELYCADIVTEMTSDGDVVERLQVLMPTLEAAILGVVFKATRALEPDNWKKCPDNGPFHDKADHPGTNGCLVCCGTDLVVARSKQ